MSTEHQGRGAQDVHLDFHTAPELCGRPGLPVPGLTVSMDVKQHLKKKTKPRFPAPFLHEQSAVTGYAIEGALPMPYSKHRLTTSFLQPLPYLVTP